MRITSFTIFNQITRSLRSGMSKMAVASERLSTGKRINKPSDDISGMMKSLDYKVRINEIEQHRRNINEADSNLGYADTTMSSVANSLIRVRELATQAASETLTADDRAAIAEEIGQLRDGILQLANSKFRDRFIFSGYQTDTEAFDAGFNYQGDAGEIHVRISRNSTMKMNVNGDVAFTAGGETYFKTIDDLYDDLQSNDVNAIQGSLAKIDAAITQVANVRADIGARMSSLDDIKSGLDERSFTFKGLLSNVEDDDITKTISEIAKLEVTLEALRASGASIMSQSLFQFLR